MRRWMSVLLLGCLLAACAPVAAPVESTATSADDIAGRLATATAAAETLSTPVPSTPELLGTPSGGEAPVPVIAFARGGGLAGASEAWTIYADGAIAFADGPEAAAQTVGRVTAEQVAALVTGLDGLGFFQMQDVYGANDNCADCFQYTVTVTNGGVTKTVTTHDAASDAPPELGQALTLIQALLDTTR